MYASWARAQEDIIERRKLLIQLKKTVAKVERLSEYGDVNKI